MTTKDEIAQFLVVHELTVKAEFVPFSQSRNAKPRGKDRPWRSLNWRITLQRAGRDILTTDYSAGEAHAPAYKALKPHQRDKMHWAPCIDWELEYGAEVNTDEGVLFGRPKTPRQPILPDSVDVWHALACDAGVLDAGGFENWASEYGYDTDSRQAASTYKECLEIALKMRSGLGESFLAHLREVVQDY